MVFVGTKERLVTYLSWLWDVLPHQLYPEDPRTAHIYAILTKLCDHTKVSYLCHTCSRPWSGPHCTARDPALRIQCQHCPFRTLA